MASLRTLLRPLSSVAVQVGLTARLMELFKKRSKIEQQILSHSRTLEQAYSAANNELKVVLKGKLEDIEQGPRVPNATHANDGQSS